MHDNGTRRGGAVRVCISQIQQFYTVNISPQVRSHRVLKGRDFSFSRVDVSAIETICWCWRVDMWRLLLPGIEIANAGRERTSSAPAQACSV
jgi:hypothetical protein